MFSEEFLNDLCRVTPESQGNIRCSNCKHYIPAAINNGIWFCEKQDVSKIPIDIRECFEGG
jgi:ribosomal protein L37AE/L43A